MGLRRTREVLALLGVALAGLIAVWLVSIYRDGQETRHRFSDRPGQEADQ